MQHSRGRRRGLNFTIRMTPEERDAIELARAGTAGPGGLGPWLIGYVLRGQCQSSAAVRGSEEFGRNQVLALPELEKHHIDWAMPARGTRSAGVGNTRPAERIILDLCGGSGAWSAPYRAAGYDVRLITLPYVDVRTYVPPADVWGILAAPPCSDFSIARNGRPRNFARGMETVNACIRLVWQCRARWWALENPGSGMLPQFLGIPQFSFQPHEFGDAWTKRTTLWGHFALPARGPFVKPQGSAMARRTAAERAVTPPGFAKAFFLANP
jgi:hypothetical protein